MPFPPTPPDEFHVATFCPFHYLFSSSSLLFSAVQSHISSSSHGYSVFLFLPCLLPRRAPQVASSAWLAGGPHTLALLGAIAATCTLLASVPSVPSEEGEKMKSRCFEMMKMQDLPLLEVQSSLKPLSAFLPDL